MADLQFSQADPVKGGATVSVWRVSPKLEFPPGINLILITETNAYSLLDGTPVVAGDWVVIDEASPAMKLSDEVFASTFAIKDAAIADLIK